MKKQFVTYEIALKLKELGFDEPCFGEYVIPENPELEIYQDNDYDMYYDKPKSICLAPLWQQAIDWLREKYSLAIGYTVAYPLSYSFHVQDLIRTTNRRNWNFNGGIEYVSDFKQGQEKAILKAIELIKNIKK